MAQYIAEWAIRSKNDAVLEPSCGEAAFLLPVVQRLKALHATESEIAQQVHGAELHAPSAEESCRLVKDASGVDLSASVRPGDFFETRVGRDFPIADVCVGNPPYIRYQSFSGDARRRGREAALAQGVSIDGLASSWAAFTVHAASFVRPGGRLGLVLPAELLSVNYAAPVRRFLLERFGSVRVVLFEERVFPGVLEEVVVLLAEGEGPCEKFDLVQVADLEHLPSLHSRKWGSLPDRGKWTDLLLSPEVAPALRTMEATGSFVELSSFANVAIGMVTGANAYFCITEEERKHLKIPRRDLLPLLPPGSKHIRGLSYEEADWQVAGQSGARAWLFYPSQNPSRETVRRIRRGELDGLDQAYKCRVRKPWYQVPLLDAPDLFLAYMTAWGPRFTQNRAHLRNVNSVHSVFLDKDVQDLAVLLPLACMSTMTMLSAELVGRAYGGGLLKLEPREAGRLAVPSPAVLRKSAVALRSAAPEIQRLLAEGKSDRAVRLVDDVLLTGTLGHDEETLSALRAGRAQLHGRRVRRSQS